MNRPELIAALRAIDGQRCRLQTAGQRIEFTAEIHDLHNVERKPTTGDVLLGWRGKSSKALTLDAEEVQAVHVFDGPAVALVMGRPDEVRDADGLIELGLKGLAAQYGNTAIIAVLPQAAKKETARNEC